MVSYSSYADLIINEIMANPIADESLNEWVEIYNNGSEEIDLYGFVIGDGVDNDTLSGGLYFGQGATIPPKGYGMVTDKATRVYNNFNYNQNVTKLYTDDESIGIGLRNDGGVLYLYDSSGNFLDKAIYNKTDLGKSFSYINGSWLQSNPTPGYRNSPTIGNNLTSDECDWRIQILINKTNFETEDEFEFRLRATKLYGGTTNISGRAYISGLSGILIREYKPWTNEKATYRRSSSKYSPRLESGKAYIINASLHTLCKDKNINNNFDKKIITINEKPKQNTSSIYVDEIYDLSEDNTAKFGQVIRVKLKIYKGDTNKRTVYLWIANNHYKITKQSKISIHDKFMSSDITIPLQINPNCDLKYPEGKYKIKVEGLGTTSEKAIRIEGFDDNLCNLNGKEEVKNKLEYKIESYPLVIENNKEFKVDVRIDNLDNTDHTVNIWSYIYRGPRCYSGKRKLNLKKVIIRKRTSKIVTLKNKVYGAKEGNYNLVVKILEENKKTEKSIKDNIFVINKSRNTILFNKKGQINCPKALSGKARIVYEAPEIKAKRLAIFLFTGLLLIYSIILTIKR